MSNLECACGVFLCKQIKHIIIITIISLTPRHCVLLECYDYWNLIFLLFFLNVFKLVVFVDYLNSVLLIIVRRQTREVTRCMLFMVGPLFTEDHW